MTLSNVEGPFFRLFINVPGDDRLNHLETFLPGESADVGAACER